MKKFFSLALATFISINSSAFNVSATENLTSANQDFNINIEYISSSHKVFKYKESNKLKGFHIILSNTDTFLNPDDYSYKLFFKGELLSEFKSNPITSHPDDFGFRVIDIKDFDIPYSDLDSVELVLNYKGQEAKLKLENPLFTTFE